MLSLPLILSLLLTACARGNQTTNTQELMLNLGSEPPAMDSAKTTDTVSFDILNQVMEGLIRMGEGDVPRPGIASKWAISPDRLTYTFTLRKDAKWSDGEPVTAQDFKFAWLRAADPNTGSEYGFFTHLIKGGEAFNTLDISAADFQAKYTDLKSKVAIETPDDHTLKVSLTAPSPYFLGLMAFPTFLPQREDIINQFNSAVGDKLEEKYAADADKMVYNGPFIIAEWVHEDHLTLAKNPSYWDADKVKLEKVTYKMVKDRNTYMQMYETGELDATSLSGPFVEQYRNDPGFSTMPDLSTFWLVLNQAKNPAFANANLRKAISHALDRTAFVESVLKNGSLPATGAVPPKLGSGMDGKDYRSVAGNLLNPAPDNAKAKEYWDKAQQELGKTGLTVKLLIDDGDVPKLMGEAIQAMLQDGLPGLKVDIDQVTFQIRLDRTRNKDYEMVFAGWGPDYNYPTTFLDLWTSESAFNDPGWKNPTYDGLLKKAAGELNLSKAAQTLAEAERLLMDELPIIPVYHRVVARVSRPYVKGILRFAIGPTTDLKYAYVEGKAK